MYGGLRVVVPQIGQATEVDCVHHGGSVFGCEDLPNGLYGLAMLMVSKKLLITDYFIYDAFKDRLLSLPSSCLGVLQSLDAHGEKV